MDKIHKVIGLFDSHYPDNIPMHSLLSYCKDHKPDVFLLGGDNWGLDIISHWNDANFKNIGFDNVKKQLKLEAEGFNQQLDDFQKVMPHAKIVYLVGNHEDWLTQFANKYPQMDDLSLGSLLNLKKRKVELIKFGKSYQIGKMYFVHGHQYTSENPPKQAVMRSHHTIILGHHHTYKVWTDYSDIVESDRYTGISVPCYCTRSPEYAKGRPNAWINGFFWANTKKSGKFSCGVQIVSPQGKFITQAGKEYE